jgi:hypothetical protein
MRENADLFQAKPEKATLKTDDPALMSLMSECDAKNQSILQGLQKVASDLAPEGAQPSGDDMSKERNLEKILKESRGL